MIESSKLWFPRPIGLREIMRVHSTRNPSYMDSRAAVGLMRPTPRLPAYAFIVLGIHSPTSPTYQKPRRQQLRWGVKYRACRCLVLSISKSECATPGMVVVMPRLAALRRVNA
jgi:hypothetical protein